MYISFSHTVYEECRKYVKALDMYFWEDFGPLVTQSDISRNHKKIVEKNTE